MLASAVEAVLLTAFFFGVTQLEAFSLSSEVVMVTLGKERREEKHGKFLIIHPL